MLVNFRDLPDAPTFDSDCQISRAKEGERGRRSMWPSGDCCPCDDQVAQVRTTLDLVRQSPLLMIHPFPKMSP
jgi:hypothetical protein